jgi:hypothetical protein
MEKRQIGHGSTIRSGMAIVAAVLALCGKTVVAKEKPLEAADVPTFQLRARVTSCEGKKPDGKQFNFALNDVKAGVEGGAWTDWLTFGPKEIEEALKRYPNVLLKEYPVSVTLAADGAVDSTLIEVETRFKEDGPVTTHTADLYGSAVRIVVWRDPDRQPHVGTAAEYNQRYWDIMKPVFIPEAERPKLFPIADVYCPGDTYDRKEWQDGLSNLAGLGANVLELEPGSPHLAQLREMLLKAGVHRTKGGIYYPPGCYFDFTANPSILTGDWTGVPGSTTPEAVAKWAQERFAPYLDAGFKREDLAMYGIADEPGWSLPLWIRALPGSDGGMERFHEYLRCEGLTPQDLGAADWEHVLPLGKSEAVNLPSRRLFYWTVRFYNWDSSRHFANVTRAMEKAGYLNIPIYANWGPGGEGRFYCPGWCGNNPDKGSPDAADILPDFLEFGLQRGGTMLWTEDWFSDALAYQWSFWCARLRSGAQRSGVQFGGYVVGRTAGDRPDGIMQKVLTLIGSGGKGFQYYAFGPDYSAPDNGWSEHAAQIVPKIAETNRMIAMAEDLLWPGKRPQAQVAILYPRDAQLWETQNVLLDDAGLNSTTVDYMAEHYDLYLALQHADIPADFVEEDDLSPQSLVPYKVLYVTEPDIPAEFQKGLLEWVQNGGTVVTVTGAGAADRYNDPCDILSKGLGFAEQPRAREYLGKVEAIPEAGKGTGSLGDFTAFGPRGKLTAAPKKGVLATFADGAPAIIERKVGEGRAVHFTWMPGISYFKSSTGTKDKLPTGFSEAIRGMITYPVRAAKVVPPATVDQAMIETPMLLSEKGAAVTLLNWSGEEQHQLKVTARVPFNVKSVESVKQGKLDFSQTEEGVNCALPLGAADILLFRP